MAVGFKLHELHRMLNWRSIGDSVERATADLPAAGANDELFTISGGRILLTGILGEVTTVIQTQANSTKLAFNPTVTGSNVDLCATADITADVVGTLYSITGTASDGLLSGLSLAGAMAASVILQPGTIELDTSATSTGKVKWAVWYIPLDYGVSVVAA
jgi:hypothetical protein